MDMRASNARVCIIMLVQSNAPQALAALAALRTACRNVSECETVVLLNGADGSTVAQLQRHAGDVRLIVSLANLGFGGGCNLAASRTDASYLAFLNDDTLVDEGWLQALVARADSDTSIGAVGSRIRFPDGTLQEAGSILWSDGSTHPVGRGCSAASPAWRYCRTVTYASACALLVRRDSFNEVGGFDETFYPAYYEDVDLCLSLASIGKRVVYEPNAELVHYESQSTTSLYKEYLFRRNRRLFTNKWHSVLPTFQLAQPDNPASVERALEDAWGKNTNVLLIDDRLPDAGLGSGYGRTLEIVADLSDSPFRVHMLASADTQLDARGVGKYGVSVIDRDLESELRDETRSYAIAIISRPHNYDRFARLIREIQPDCRICYDVESLFYRRMEKQAMQAMRERDVAEALRLMREADLARQFEFDIARSADRLVCISVDEQQIMQSVNNHAPIDFILPVSRNIAVTETSFHDRAPLIVYVAGWMAGDTSPNADGLRWLAREVVPTIRARLPHVKILVTGANPPMSLLPFASPLLEFIGFVSDLSALYSRARVAIAPLRFGAGVKIKTIEAVQYGVPVVATTVGAEGLEMSFPGSVLISNDAEAFAALIIRLVSQADSWLSARNETIAQSSSWLSMQSRTWRKVCDEMLHGKLRTSL